MVGSRIFEESRSWRGRKKKIQRGYLFFLLLIQIQLKGWYGWTACPSKNAWAEFIHENMSMMAARAGEIDDHVSAPAGADGAGQDAGL